MQDWSAPAVQVMAGLARVSLALRVQEWKGAAKAGLTPTQGLVLAFLSNARPDGLRLNEIAARIGTTAATASECVSALVRKGLIEKSRSRDDARAVALRLTRRGRAQADRVAGWTGVLLQVVSALDAAEQAALLRALTKIIRSLQLRKQISVAKMCLTCRYFRPRMHADPAAPHHCDFVDAAFGDKSLRLHCPDHEPAAGAHIAEAFRALAAVSPEGLRQGPR